MRSMFVGFGLLAVAILGFCLRSSGFEGAAGNDKNPVSSPRFDVCDISFLWPVPAKVEDAQRLISADMQNAEMKEVIWPQEAFARMLEIAESEAATIKHPTGAVRKIALKPEFRTRRNWKVVAIRVDGGAPGGHSAIVEKFGSAPQIRLILQPVTVSGAKVDVHDVAAHLVYNFVLKPKQAESGFLPINVPDKEAFAKVIEDLIAIKAFLKSGGIDTAGALLGVHPGFRSEKSKEFQVKIESLLKTHLSEKRLTAMAFMGLAPHPEPWLFVASARGPMGTFQAASIPALGFRSSQMLTARDGNPQVVPEPTPTNRNAITSFLGIKPEDRRGVSTLKLLEKGIDLEAPAALGRKADGTAILDEAKEGRVLNRDVPDLIANPTIAHFFNTDCVSCHTESTRRKELKLGADSAFRFKLPVGISGIDPDALPKEPWNVRNFGWFPSFFQKTVVPTVSQRTANEAADAAAFLNQEFVAAAKK